MPTWLWAGGAGAIGALALLLFMRRSIKIKFGMISIVALFSGSISSASSATTMYAILDGTGVIFQTLFPAAFGALIAFGMVLSAKRQRLAALMIFIPSTLTSAAAFNSAIRYAEEGKSTAVEQMDAVRDTKKSLEDQLKAERVSITTIASQIGAEREALASAEIRLAKAEAALVGRTAVASLEAEIDRKRREIDELQDQMDCERVGTAAKPGCLGFGGVPVSNAGTGERWTAAFKRINGDPETGTNGLREELANLERQRGTLDSSLVKTRDQAAEAVVAARQSVSALISARGSAETRADEVQDKIDAWKPPKKPWAAVTWESLDDLVADNDLGKSLGITMEGFKTFGGLWLATMFDFLASLLGVENRKRRPWRGFGGTWEAVRDWFVHGDGEVEIEGGYAADTHVITTRLGRFTGATEAEARDKAIAAERRVEDAREVAQDARIEAKAEAQREKARRASEKAKRRSEREKAPSLAALAAQAAGRGALSLVGRTIGAGAQRVSAPPATRARRGSDLDPAEKARRGAVLADDIAKALDAGGHAPVEGDDPAGGLARPGARSGERSMSVSPDGQRQADPEGLGGAPLFTKKSAAAHSEDPVDPDLGEEIPSEDVHRGAAGLSGETPDAVAASEGLGHDAQSGETEPEGVDVEREPDAFGPSVQDAVGGEGVTAPAPEDHSPGEEAAGATPSADTADREEEGRPAVEDVQPLDSGEAFEMKAARSPSGGLLGQGGREGVPEASGPDGPADPDRTSEAGPSQDLADQGVDETPDPLEEVAPFAGVDEDTESLDDVMERARRAMQARRRSLRDANEEALDRERGLPDLNPSRRPKRIEDAFIPTASDGEGLGDKGLDGDPDPQEPLVLTSLDGARPADDLDQYEEDAGDTGVDEGFSVGGVAIEDLQIDPSEMDNGSWSIGEEWAADHANRPRTELPNSIAESHDGRPAGSPSAMAALRRGQKAKEARAAERVAGGRTIKGGRRDG